jgi:hypothetical protein
MLLCIQLGEAAPASFAQEACRANVLFSSRTWDDTELISRDEWESDAAEKSKWEKQGMPTDKGNGEKRDAQKMECAIFAYN